MIDLNSLKTTEKHPLNVVFKGYSKRKIADILSVSPGYFTNVLNGQLPPSKKLDQKISALASQIQQTEQAEAEAQALPLILAYELQQADQEEAEAQAIAYQIKQSEQAEAEAQALAYRIKKAEPDADAEALPYFLQII